MQTIQVPRDPPEPSSGSTGWGSARAGIVAAPFATAVGLGTVVVIVSGGDRVASEGRLPVWVTGAVIAAVAATVAGIWVLRAYRPGATTGLALASTGALLPTLAGWSALPDALGAATLAATPLTVPGLIDVMRRWPAGRGRAPWRSRAVFGLAAAAALAHLVTYNPFLDPGCARTCAEISPLLDGVSWTRIGVAISSLLTIGAAFGMVGVGSGSGSPLPRPVRWTAIASVGAVAAASAVRWVMWGHPTVGGAVSVVPPLALALLAATASVVSARILRTRAAVQAMTTRLSEPGHAALGGGIVDVHFAMEDGRHWVDIHGQDVTEAPAQDRSVMLFHDSSPVLRLVLRRGADPGDVLAGITPAEKLALRNAQLAAVARRRLSDVQASQRRVVSTTDAERRRIERDLHDGAQQRLVGATFHLRVALADADPHAAAVLTGTVGHIHEALASLRDLAHGLFPSVLAGEGLVAAIEEMAAGSDVPMDLRLAEVEGIGIDESMAAYALVAAVLREAERDKAQLVSVSVSRSGGTLDVLAEIPARTENHTPDLTEVADRVGALGGRFVFSEYGDGGMAVRALIPCE